MLERNIQRRLDEAKANEAAYRPNDAVRQKLAEKTFVMFVAPVAVGKSFLMNYVADAEPLFSRVPVFTTREPRKDDEPGMFRHVPHDSTHLDKLLGQIERGEVVQYIVHPTTGNIYGSMPEDYASEITMLATLSGTVELLRRLPFKKTVAIGVAASPEVWMQRIDARYPDRGAERKKRLAEARTSLDWLLSTSYVKWVNNTSSDTSAARRSVVNIVKYNQDGDPAARVFASEMRALLETKA
jgi:guanylate kinase